MYGNPEEILVGSEGKPAVLLNERLTVLLIRTYLLKYVNY